MNAQELHFYTFSEVQKLEDTEVSRSGIKCYVISVIIQFAITTKN